MIKRFKIQLRILLTLTLLITLFTHTIEAGEKDSKDAKESKDAKTEVTPSKLDLMRHLINSWSIRTKEKRAEPLAFVQEPVMRYHDPKYKVTDCAIWRLGKTGRPRAYVVIEMDHPKGTGGRATYEFLAVSEGPFRISGGVVRWQPWELGVTFMPLPDAPKPAATAAERLKQMEQLAMHFSAESMLGREKVYLNLHPTPFDRYKPTDAKNSDAAVFQFERGFNPEVLLFFETDGEKWSYGCGKISATAVLVNMDKKQVWSAPKTSSRPKADQVSYAWTNGYTASREVFRIPPELSAYRTRTGPLQAIPAQSFLPKQKLKQPEAVKPKVEQPQAVKSK